MKTARIATIVAMAFLSLPPAGAAQEGSADDEDLKQAARAAFDEGVALFQSGELSSALEAFSRSEALRPTPSVLYNLGRCHRALGHRLLARRYYLRFVEEAKSAGRETGVDKALAELDKLGQELARVTIVDCEAGAKVTLDGAEAGVIPLAEPLFVEPGTHSLRLTKEGFAAIEVELELKAGGEAVVPAKLTALPTPLPSGAKPSTPAAARLPVVPTNRDPRPSKYNDRTRRAFALGLGGAGLASLAVGIAFGAQYPRHAAEARQASRDKDRPAYDDASKAIMRDNVVLVVGAGLAAALIAGSVALLIVDKKSAARSHEIRATATSVQLLF